MPMTCKQHAKTHTKTKIFIETQIIYSLKIVVLLLHVTFCGSSFHLFIQSPVKSLFIVYLQMAFVKSIQFEAVAQNGSIALYDDDCVYKSCLFTIRSIMWLLRVAAIGS